MEELVSMEIKRFSEKKLCLDSILLHKEYTKKQLETKHRYPFYKKQWKSMQVSGIPIMIKELSCLDILSKNL